MAILTNPEKITTNFITRYSQQSVIDHLKDEVKDCEYYGLFAQYSFCAEFENKRDLITWYLEKDPAFQNLPEKVFQLFNEDQIMNQLESEYLVIPVHHREYYTSKVSTIFYVFAEEKLED